MATKFYGALRESCTGQFCFTVHPSVPENVRLMGTESTKMAKSVIERPSSLISTFDVTPNPLRQSYELLNIRANNGPFLRVPRNG